MLRGLRVSDVVIDSDSDGGAVRRGDAELELTGTEVRPLWHSGPAPGPGAEQAPAPHQPPERYESNDARSPGV